MRLKWTVATLFGLLLSCFGAGQSFVVRDPVDNHPLQINGGLGGEDNDGMEPAILIAEGNTSDMYITPGLARLSAESFLKNGMYRVILFSHYHRDAFCKLAAKDQLKPEYVSSCRMVGYRSCYLGVDTWAQKFELGVPWPCVFLSVTGQPLIGIAKPGSMPSGWVSFDSLATKDRWFLKVIDEITAKVRKIIESTN